MTDKMREEFEAWANGDVDLDISKMSDGGYYRNIQTIIAWDAWQSSRAVLCVELPEVRVLDGGRIAEIGYELAVDDFERALDAVGVQYK